MAAMTALSVPLLGERVGVHPAVADSAAEVELSRKIVRSRLACDRADTGARGGDVARDDGSFLVVER